MEALPLLTLMSLIPRLALSYCFTQRARISFLAFQSNLVNEVTRKEDYLQQTVTLQNGFPVVCTLSHIGLLNAYIVSTPLNAASLNVVLVQANYPVS